MCKGVGYLRSLQKENKTGFILVQPQILGFKRKFLLNFILVLPTQNQNDNASSRYVYECRASHSALEG